MTLVLLFLSSLAVGAPHTDDKASCERQKGKWGRFGLYELDQCNLPTTDAGRVCTDSSQCQSACVLAAVVPSEKFHKRGECSGPGDKGKPCESVRDCGPVEVCQIIFDPIPGKGVCYGWTILRGTCLNHVKSGTALAPLCID